MGDERIKGQVPIVNKDKKIVGLINFEIIEERAIITSLDGVAKDLDSEYIKELVWQSLEMYSLLHPDKMEIANKNRIRSFNINLNKEEKNSKTM